MADEQSTNPQSTPATSKENGESSRNVKIQMSDEPYPNLKMPIGYDEILTLMAHAKAVLTDSGTVVEETAVLGVPSLQIRRATERPQVYDCRSSVKFDPSAIDRYPFDTIWSKLASIEGTTWEHALGDGKASQRIIDDLVQRTLTPNGFRNHLPERYHLDISRSYREDGL